MCGMYCKSFYVLSSAYYFVYIKRYDIHEYEYLCIEIKIHPLNTCSKYTFVVDSWSTVPTSCVRA